MENITTATATATATAVARKQICNKLIDVSISYGDCEEVEAVAAAAHFITTGEKEGRVYLGNAFSLQMAPEWAIISKLPCDREDIPDDALSVIGHADTARVVGNLLGREVPFNRASISLGDGDVLYVAQVIGGRLPEGAIELPEGIELKFYKVVVRC